MTRLAHLNLTQITSSDELSSELREELIDCWMTVANAGGAVGFAFPPVDIDAVALVANRLIAGLSRWPDALRFSHGDRDEVVMLLAPL